MGMIAVFYFVMLLVFFVIMCILESGSIIPKNIPPSTLFRVIILWPFTLLLGISIVFKWLFILFVDPNEEIIS